MGTDAQKCDIFRDMGGQEGPVQETARGTDVLQRGCQSPHLAGTLSRDSEPGHCRTAQGLSCAKQGGVSSFTNTHKPQAC